MKLLKICTTASQLRILFTLLYVWMVWQPTAAQDEVDKVMDKYVKVVQVKDSLEKQLKALQTQQNTETAEINKQHKKELDQKERQLKDTVRVLNDTINAKNKQLKDLHKELGKSSKETVAAFSKQLADLTAECDRLQTENDKLSKRQNLSDSIIAARDAELKELLPFREQQLKQTLEKAKEWSSLPFSQLDQQVISKMLDDCRRYGGNNADFKKAATDLGLIQADLNLFTEAQALLNQSFDEVKKDAVRQRLKTLMAKYRGKPQLMELTETDELLRDYDGYVLFFQDLINKLNSELEDGREDNNKRIVAETLKQVWEEQQENIREVEKIPYLKQQLSDYLAALKKNPLQHWSGEVRILEMVK